MSRRGSKRKQVLQLSNANSKLHRYGYSKEFHSKDKTGKGLALALVGNYSDSDSNEPSDNEEQTADQSEVDDGDLAAENNYEATQDTGGTLLNENITQPSDMDNKLKSFLSEIEAIPVPSSLVSGPSRVSPAHPTQEPDAVADAPPVKKPSTNHYSMFVKGEVEFVQKPQQIPESQSSEKDDKVSKRIEDEDLPDEPTTSWHLVQDETTQYYYYWNMVTNQVTWEIPSDYTQFLLLHQEYEEKIAKYTPEQLKILQEKKAKKCVQNCDSEHPGDDLSNHSSHAPPLPSLSDHSSSLPPNPSSNHLSPLHPESDSDSKKSKHKKEKKSHPKKKLREKDSDGMSDRNKALSELDQMKASSLSALAKIVPYLSDQDDEDDQSVSQTDTNVVPEKVLSANVDLSNCADSPQTSPTSASSQVVAAESNLSTCEKGQLKIKEVLRNKIEESEASPLTNKTLVGTALTFSGFNNVDEIINSILQPTVPTFTGKDITKEENVTLQRPHTEKSDEIAKKSKLPSADVVCDSSLTLKIEASNSLDDIKNNESVVPEEHILDSIKKEILSEEKPIASVKVVKHVHKGSHSSEKNSKTHPSVDKRAKKEVFTSDKNSKAVSSVDFHKRNISKRETIDMFKAEPVEEGEITETVKTSSHSSDKHGKHAKKSSSSRYKDKHESSSEKKKVLNIVGYESEEEEEGEVRDKRKHDDSRNSYKKKKKDKKRESSRRHSKDEKPVYPTLFEGKLDKEIISKVTDTLDQAISDIVSKTVSKTIGQLTVGKEKKVKIPEEEKPKTPEEENEDIDFDDLDDIDRALEVALEKKLEQKKVELSKYEEEEPKKVQVAEADTSSAVTSEVTSLTPMEMTESMKEEVPAGAPCTPPEANVDIKTEESTECDTKLKEDVKCMAELALNKLEFLDISTENLSRLQLLFIELQTRQTDWIAGGLSTQYFYEQLKVAEGLLEQYELSAVPEGWACQWDRANNRYYYRNKTTNRIQWDYPETETKDKSEEKAASVLEEADVICTKIESAVAPEEPRRPRSRRGSRHRKRDDKDRSKYDKRSTSHHYRRKRRRRRDHSSSSEESELSQQHRRHHKSKKKKRHRTERSPSVKIIENPTSPDNQPAEVIDVTSKEDLTIKENITSPVKETQPEVTTEPPAAPPPLLAPYAVPPPPPEEPPNEDSNIVQDMEESADESYPEEYNMYPDETVYQLMDPTMSSMGVISKPPQIIVPQQCYPNTMMPDVYATYPPPVIMTAGQPCSYLIQAPVADGTAYSVPPISTETVTELPKESATEAAAGDSDKQTKKKKKDKKSLATGSSIMMKKKHMSSMVQKWQKVKKEVEKEDMAKEMRQAAIRKKIEELK